MNIFNFTLYIKKYILLENIVWKKVVSAVLFYLVFMDIWNAVMVHQSSIYINIRIKI